MEAVESPQEQRVILHGVSWETYERLLADHADSSAPRFAYNRGKLQIMSPEHERINYNIALMAEILAEEMDVDVLDPCSTTFEVELTI